MNHQERIAQFVEEIWSWYSVHKRSLPWRDLEIKDDTERAYRILVSEIMLQQTQVDRVKIVFRNFLEQFSSIKDLAQASNKDVLIAWRGMGYNSRALRLRDTARAVVDDHQGMFPQSMEALIALPGVGHYTAGAIRNFAFNIPTPCIDTNIRRILHRTFVGPENADGTWEKDDQYLLKIASEMLNIALDRTTPYPLQPTTSQWHAALMDFGSLVQTKRNPKWDICPLTVRGIMKTTPRSFSRMLAKSCKLPATSYKLTQEPGRMVGSTFIPNRIFRGRVIEQLRDEHRGLSIVDIGQRISVDWNPDEHKQWLSNILEKLKKDLLIEEKRGKFLLRT